MTAAQTDAPATPSTEVAVQRYNALVRRAMDEVKAGRMTIADVVAELAKDSLPAAPEPKAPGKVPELSPAVLEALNELPGLWEAVVIPSAPRKLTAPESAALARLRECIDVISGPLAKAKSEVIRDVVHDHLDADAEAKGLAFPAEEEDEDLGIVHEATPRGANGHYLLKQVDAVPGTGKRWERRVSKGAVTMSAARIQAAYEGGRLTREQYLAVTSVPEVPRTFDPQKAVKAVVKDPALLALLSEVGTEVSVGSTSIYLVDDK